MSRHQLWRESATLMLIARSGVSRTPFDYRVLLLQRSSKSRFMPSRYVFPGGVIENADFSEEWMDLYQKSSVGSNFSSLINMKEPRPPIFRKSSTAIPSEVALRICAIRETFEESGILLLKKMSGEDKTTPQGCCDVYEHQSEVEMKKWREDVHHNPTKFIELCRHLKSVPDIWSLGEWLNWLTPPDLKIRFDTAFFISFVDHEPLSQHDNKETTHSQWKKPIEGIMDYYAQKIMIGAPQLYTFSQLCRITKWEELKVFQETRANEGSDRWMTIRIKCKDEGQIGVLPGDDLFPMALDYVAKQTNGEYGVRDGIVPVQQLDETVEELETRTKNHHRFVSKSKKSNKFLVNCSLMKDVLPPLTDTNEIQKLALNVEAKL